jgi:hypothetical protein
MEHGQRAYVKGDLFQKETSFVFVSLFAAAAGKNTQCPMRCSLTSMCTVIEAIRL